MTWLWIALGTLAAVILIWIIVAKRKEKEEEKH